MKRSDEALIAANSELALQNIQKEMRAAELLIANEELIFQNDEKGKRAAELIIANAELIFQNEEKGKRAAELIIANAELVFQNAEKGKRAAELIIANAELVFQNAEKGKRAAELIIANTELVFQNAEKGKRAAELIQANSELVFQNEENEKISAELIKANLELVYQNDERGKRAAELLIANAELVFQNEEKGKRAAELIAANKELEAFTYISSHDLQEPLRKIQTFATFILEREYDNLSDKGKEYIHRIRKSAERMRSLIIDLLSYSRTNATERKFETIDLSVIIEDVKADLKEAMEEKSAKVEYTELTPILAIQFQFHQLIYNLVSNSLKFSKQNEPSHIVISSKRITADDRFPFLMPGKEYNYIDIKDNGIGFEPEFSKRIFEVFQKLHSKEDYAGTGIGLAIVKKIVENHYGTILATSELGNGATFDIYIPADV